MAIKSNRMKCIRQRKLTVVGVFFVFFYLLKEVNDEYERYDRSFGISF